MRRGHVWVQSKFKPVELNTIGLFASFFGCFEPSGTIDAAQVKDKYCFVWKHRKKQLPGLDINWFHRLIETSSHRYNDNCYLKFMRCLKILSGHEVRCIWKAPKRGILHAKETGAKFIYKIVGLHVKDYVERLSFLRSSFPNKAIDLVSWSISQLTELKVQYLLERSKVFFKVLGNKSHQSTFIPRTNLAWNSTPQRWNYILPFMDPFEFLLKWAHSISWF